MPLEPRRAKHPDQKYNLVVLVDGWMKNEIIDAANKAGISIQQWCSTIIGQAIREQHQLPTLKDGQRLPTPADAIHSYLTGERTLMPCGKTDCTPVPTNLDKQVYCDTCGCRLQ